MKNIRHEFPLLDSILLAIPTFPEYNTPEKIDLKTQFIVASVQTSTYHRTAYLNTDYKLDAFLAFRKWLVASAQPQGKRDTSLFLGRISV